MRSALFLLVLALPAGAVMPGKSAKSDARRFGLDKPAESEAGDAAREAREVSEFNASHRGRWNLRFGPLGVGPGAAPAARLSAKEAAESFLRERGPGLGLDPGQLRLSLARSIGGAHHLLFEQVVDGVPVEFGSVKVHLDESGQLLGYSSDFRSVAGVSPVPQVSEARAAAAVGADLGMAAPAGGRLVFFPPPSGGQPRLAWKFRQGGRGGSWVYYVDARDGSVLFRYDDLRYQAACLSSGTVHGMVYDIDPSRQAGAAARPIRHQRVYVLNASTYAVTNTSGFFCSQTSGKIFTQLQGPYVAVSNWNGPAAHYDNGGALWTTFATPVQSAHPYAASTVHVATINAPAGALKVMPVFSSIDVGEYTLSDGDLSIIDNDQVQLLDAQGDPVATYIGQRTNLKGAAVPGTQLRVRLKPNESKQRDGYSISVSSYLAWSGSSAEAVPANQTATFTWTASHTIDSTLDEVNVFYQLNMMHDYFRGGPNSSGAAGIDKPVPTMVRVGPSMANAFYDPVQGNLSFGDLNSVFALDATVVRHEYVHFVIDQIYPIVNFGQHGAISEAISDYFAASSLDLPSIGGYTGQQFGSGSLRELDCSSNPPCKTFPTDWNGAIHDDSQMVSQALWEIRKSLISSLGSANGKTCSDGLVFNSLFYYPDSFADLVRAMKAVSARSATAVPVCGANNTQDGLIQAQFSNHGIVIPTGDQDVYEPNDGVASATDITTAAAVSARIYPAADQDWFAFGAGAGRISLTLTLPENPAAPGNYFAYAMTLVDRTFAIVAQGNPTLDINATLGGNCPESDCMTSRRTVTLNYDNHTPGQFFVLVSAPPGDESAVSRNNSSRFYSLTASIPTGAASAGVVSAQFDRDTIDFTASVSTFSSGQVYSFHHARLRDHNLAAIPDTETHAASPWLTMISSVAKSGVVSGRVRLTSGFASRFPAVGNVYLEVFGQSPLGQVQTLGMSNSLALTGTGASVKAFNNLFNPARGGKATVRWQSTGSGRVRMRLFTTAGQLVTTLLDEDRPAGTGAVDWTGVNGMGQRVASGVYILHVSAPGLDETVKFVVVK